MINNLQTLIKPAIKHEHNLVMFAPEPEFTVHDMERLIGSCRLVPGLVTFTVMFSENCDVLQTSTRNAIKYPLISRGFGYREMFPCFECGKSTLRKRWNQKYCRQCRRAVKNDNDKASKRRRIIAKGSRPKPPTNPKVSAKVAEYPVVIYQCTECPGLCWASGRPRVVCGPRCKGRRKRTPKDQRQGPTIWEPRKWSSLHIFEELLMEIGDPLISLEINSRFREHRKGVKIQEKAERRAWERMKKWLRFSGLIKKEMVAEGKPVDGGGVVTMTLDRKRLQRLVDTYVTGDVKPVSETGSWNSKTNKGKSIEWRKKPWLRNRE